MRGDFTEDKEMTQETKEVYYNLQDVVKQKKDIYN